MQNLRISKLGSEGLNTDVEPWELTPEFLSAGVNFRVYSGKVSATGGTISWSNPLSQGGGPLSYGLLMQMGVSSRDKWLVCGDTVYSFDASTWAVVDVDLDYPDPTVFGWTACMLGQVAVFNNITQFPSYIVPASSGQAAGLPFDPDNTWQDLDKSCNSIRAHKNFLIALNLREGPLDLHSSFRWSHPADINGLPFTWDETDRSAIAGIAQIGSDVGEIVDGLSLRGRFLIYSERGIHILDFTGGEFVWKLSELSNSVGLLSANCVVEVNEHHYFIGDGDILRTNGNRVESILFGRLLDKLRQLVSPGNIRSAYVMNNISKKEIWFCINTSTTGSNATTAMVFNWKEESWSIRDLPKDVAHTAYGSFPDTSATSDIWDNGDDLTWDTSGNTPWGSQSQTPSEATVHGLWEAQGGDIAIASMDLPDSKQPFANSEVVPTRPFVERTYFDLDGVDGVTTLLRCYPHMTGSQDVEILFGSADFIGGPIRWQPAQVFNPSTDRKLDIRTTGALHCFRLSSIVEEPLNHVDIGDWVFTGVTLEFQQDGKR